MELTEFRNSLEESAAPSGVSIPLQALWMDGKNNWNGAHDLLQQDHTSAGAWVHAYLHRREGDLSNAAYWYRRAGQPVASGEFSSEWDAIVSTLLSE